MKSLKRQRGSLLIIAVVMIVIIGFLSTVITSLSVGQGNADLDDAGSTQALYLADSGLERGIRQWLQNPGTYTGEGPVSFGSGTFTVTVSTTDASGAPLSANQRRIDSAGEVATAGGTAKRTAEIIAQTAGWQFNEPFPDLNNWLTTGPNGDTFYIGCSLNGLHTTVPYTQGSAFVDATENAPGSTGGAFRAQVVAGKNREELGGYNERTLTDPLLSGQSISLNFWYKKILGVPTPLDMMMAIDLVATDGTVYRPWSDCTVGDVAWTSLSVPWTVPAGMTIDRIRLSYYIQNANGKKKDTIGAAASELFDQIVLFSPINWQDVVP